MKTQITVEQVKKLDEVFSLLEDVSYSLPGEIDEWDTAIDILANLYNELVPTRCMDCKYMYQKVPAGTFSTIPQCIIDKPNCVEIEDLYTRLETCPYSEE